MFLIDTTFGNHIAKKRRNDGCFPGAYRADDAHELAAFNFEIALAQSEPGAGSYTVASLWRCIVFYLYSFAAIAIF